MIIVELVIIDKEILLESILIEEIYIKQNLKSDSKEINNYRRQYERQDV